MKSLMFYFSVLTINSILSIAISFFYKCISGVYLRSFVLETLLSISFADLDIFNAECDQVWQRLEGNLVRFRLSIPLHTVEFLSHEFSDSKNMAK